MNGHEDDKARGDDCIVEPLIPDERYLSPKKSPEHERESIRAYMGSQASDETITHLEKIASEGVYGRHYDVWDVHTDKERWWVITLPTNLYSQAMFPSMDMCLTFHIGLSSRILGTEDEQDDTDRLIIKSSRRLSVAFETLETAREVEDFQAVGVKLREALLGLVRDLASPTIVPAGSEQPKLGDFIHWSEFIIDALTTEESLKRVRTGLKAAGKDTWQLANGLTHTTSADKTLAWLAAEEVAHVFGQWAALMRAATSEDKYRCPICDSLQVTKRTAIEGADEFEELLCASCGATARKPMKRHLA
jgi:hypothetical protein